MKLLAASLTGQTNEQHVRSAGADGYVAKFKVEDLAKTKIAGLQVLFEAIDALFQVHEHFAHGTSHFRKSLAKEQDAQNEQDDNVGH